ncbi:MAG: endonuclease domain-containing protein [Bacteroidales bacterium]|nr:endonuclease domain-containing protein [Bacteroidales bacterium]MBS3776680.1 endonuclease domain-containing protein [Bacteroidales bacterium]
MKRSNIEKKMFYEASSEIFRRALILRNKMTQAEKLLWEHLRKKKLGVRFKPQHPIGRFIADFYCHQAKLVVEIDGEIHDGQKEYDIGRAGEMEEYGIRVLRFKNSEVFEDIEGVVERIQEML